MFPPESPSLHRARAAVHRRWPAPPYAPVRVGQALRAPRTQILHVRTRIDCLSNETDSWDRLGAHTCIFDQVHVGVRCAFANRQLAGVPEPSNDNDLSRFLPVSLLEAVSLARTPASSRLSVLHVRVFAPGSPRPPSSPHSLQFSRMAGFAADTRAWPTGACQAPRTCLSNFCVFPQIWCLIQSTLLPVRIGKVLFDFPLLCHDAAVFSRRGAFCV